MKTRVYPVKLYNNTRLFSNMMLFLVLTCWIGIAAGVDEEDDEIESLTVTEGGNLTISVHIEKSDEDPQVLVTRLKGSSQEPIAQVFCHNGACAQKCWRPGVSLVSDGENTTLILMNVSYNQTGLYKVCKLSSRQPQNKIYKLTVYQPPLRTISTEQPASAVHSKSFTAGISTAAVVLVLLVIICAVTGVIYRKHEKASIIAEQFILTCLVLI
ncbi:uncharacterized protein [Sinocyclocheilus grahami]|uniref:uncharacterized protein n=1 Tax=Sinocyclocheilus grahami TaxID=75366 RepID=UPI0007AD2BF9|nr:PREDICTED: uncharacterized protein LOC107550147 [Sinocyclocheilus grahami]